MQIFDAKKHCELLDAYIIQKLSVTKPAGKLLIVLIGDNPASLKYIGVKIKLCEKLGIPVWFEHIDSNLSDEEILLKVEKAFNSSEVSGGLIQLPLPRPSLKKSLELIPPHKDVDLLSSTKSSQYYAGDFSDLPPVVRGFVYFVLTAVGFSQTNLSDSIAISTAPKHLQRLTKNNKYTIIGNGFLVGEPISHFLAFNDITPRINENYTNGVKIYSDFLISGAGAPNLIAGQDISENCNVLDFGISIIDGKVVGDFDKNSSTDHLGLVSFPPGGIGPIVVRFLLMNFLGV